MGTPLAPPTPLIVAIVTTRPPASCAASSSNSPAGQGGTNRGPTLQIASTRPALTTGHSQCRTRNPAVAGLLTMGDPGLEPGTSSLSERRELLSATALSCAWPQIDHFPPSLGCALVRSTALRRFQDASKCGADRPQPLDFRCSFRRECTRRRRAYLAAQTKTGQDCRAERLRVAGRAGSFAPKRTLDARGGCSQPLLRLGSA